MYIRSIVIAAVCSGISISGAAQNSPELTAPATREYEEWEQFSPRVKAALLFIMAAGFDSMAAIEEQGLSPNSITPHRIFLEKVLELDVSFMSGDDYEYFSTMLRINRDRLEALRALPESADKAEITKIKSLHADELKEIKIKHGYQQIDTIIMEHLTGLQQKYMQECIKESETSKRSPLRHFAEKLREESIMQF